VGSLSTFYTRFVTKKSQKSHKKDTKKSQKRQKIHKKVTKKTCQEQRAFSTLPVPADWRLADWPQAEDKP
jgi:hypothetical protein